MNTEFKSRALKDWANRAACSSTSFDPENRGKAFIESFNGRPRDEYLNVHQFTSLT